MEKQRSKSKKMGRPSIIANAVTEFVETIKTDEDAYNEIWQIEWEKHIKNKALSTRAAYVSRYRSAIKESLGSKHPSLNYIKVLEHNNDTDEEELKTYASKSNAGRPNTRQEAIKTFVQQTKLLKEESQKKGKKALYSYKRGLTKLWNTMIQEWRTKLEPKTIIFNSSLYRNALREAKLADDITLSIVKAPEDIQETETKAYRQSIIEHHNELVAIPHWFDLIETAKNVLPKTNAHWSILHQEAQKMALNATRKELVRYGVALGLLTGRRIYEIFCQGAIVPQPIVIEQQKNVAGRGYESWWILFTGQAKTRGREGTQFDKPFQIPTLTTAKDIVFAWTVLRLSDEGQIWHEMSNEEFKNDLLRTPNPNAIYPSIRKELFSPHWPQSSLEDSKNTIETKRLTANNVRALYAEIADNFFRPKSQTKAAFFAEILGHTEKDIETANAYMKYYLPDQKDAGPTKRVKKQLVNKQTIRAKEKKLI